MNSAVAAGSLFGSWISENSAQQERLVGAVMRDADFDDICHRRSLEPINGQRRRPDGARVMWRLAGLESMVRDGLPAFIEWMDPDPVLGSGTGEIEMLELGGAGVMEAWLGTHVHSVRIEDGPVGPKRAVVRRGQAVAEILAGRHG
jgi:hypothetical protein